MSKSIEIKQGSFGYYKQGVYYIVEGEAFRDQHDNVRTFKTVSSAVSWLRKVCKQYPGTGYIVTKPDGSKILLGAAIEEALDETVYGPHVWHKKNLVTLMDKSGSYDIYECEYCRITEKSHGLSGHSVRSGSCVKNLKEKNGMCAKTSSDNNKPDETTIGKEGGFTVCQKCRSIVPPQMMTHQYYYCPNCGRKITEKSVEVKE